MGSNHDRVDVIAVGAGGAGMIAAMAAVGQGARVLHFEKTSAIGGCWLPGIGNAGSLSGAQTVIQYDSGIFDDSPELFYADCMHDTRARSLCDSEILKYYCRNSGMVVDWLDRLGAFGSRERRAKGGLFGEKWSVPRSYYMAQDFLKAVTRVYHEYIARGDIRLLLETPVIEITRTEGRIAGVVAAVNSEKKLFTARAVVVATGGFAADIDMVRRYNLPQAGIITTVAMPFATGDGFNMCLKAGAGIVNAGNTMIMGPFPGGITDLSRSGRELATVDIGCPGVIAVDRNGRRFVNEACGRLNPLMRDALSRCPNNTLFAIFDHATLEIGGVVSSGARCDIERLAMGGGVVARAGTLEELASRLNIDGVVLRESIEHWNRQVNDGSDYDFKRTGPLRAIEYPPYYAISLGVRVVASCGGPRTNVFQQVLDGNDRVIPGLYAAGEVAGYQGYGTGMFNTGCVVFGKQAGRMAAREALGWSIAQAF